MGTIAPNYGTRTAYPNVANLNSIANAAAVHVGNVSNGTAPAGLAAPAVGFKVDAQVKLAASAVSATGTVTFYLIESTDGGTTYTDNIAIGTATNQATLLKNARPLMVAAANAVNQVVTVTFFVPANNDACPKDHTILVLNNSGAALLASGHVVNYTAINYAD